ncbi:MAG: cupin domain-containing protein [Holophagaceae bacterium]|nr:cupin domain-containing protein [Holophagaceae bacterium]
MRIHSLEDLPIASLGTGIQKRMLVGSGMVPHVMQFVRACFSPGQVAPAHAHPDMTEMFYIESGEGTLTVDGVSHPLQPGVSFLVEPKEKHEIASSPGSELVVVYVSVHS